MTTIALFGAAGKIGGRVAQRLHEASQYITLFVESGDTPQAVLRERGLQPTLAEVATPLADVVILAVPDRLLGEIAHQTVPQMKSGAMLMLLDPDAAIAGELPERSDISIYVTHPCHPQMFNDETDLEAKRDYFGGIKARQHVVSALMQGNEDDYVLGEALSRVIFHPVMNVYRITIFQMAILEPVLAEVLAFACLDAVKQGIEEAEKLGLPYEAAKEFVLGHMNIILAIQYGYLDTRVSDGAMLALERGRKLILNPDWKDVLKPENIIREAKAIAHGIHEV
jgi:hypothetical protein